MKEESGDDILDLSDVPFNCLLPVYLARDAFDCHTTARRCFPRGECPRTITKRYRGSAVGGELQRHLVFK